MFRYIFKAEINYHIILVLDLALVPHLRSLSRAVPKIAHLHPSPVPPNPSLRSHLRAQNLSITPPPYCHPTARQIKSSNPYSKCYNK